MDIQVNGNARELETLFPKVKSETKTFHQSYWSSPEAFSAHIEKMDKKKAWHDSAWEEGDPSWRGTGTMAEALKISREGWKDGATKASRLLGSIMAANPLQKKPVRYGIAGSTPNVPRAIAGDPLNMRIPDMKKASRRPVITLLSNIAANCGHQGEEFTNRAAVVAALVDQIEAAGYCCEIIAFAQATNYNAFVSRVAVQIKNSNQPLDITRLAFGLGHPAMFRRLVFADWGINPFCRPLGHGLGHTSTIANTEDLIEKGIFILPAVEGTDCFKTEKTAEKEGLKYIIEGLQAQKFPIFQKQK